jgi:enoyl-CoA hydratase
MSSFTDANAAPVPTDGGGLQPSSASALPPSGAAFETSGVLQGPRGEPRINKMVRLAVTDEGIAVLTLSNPPLNLNTLATIDELLSACTILSADQRVRVVVITGQGDKAFCAGSDITEFADVRDDVVAKKLGRENAAFTAIERLPQPVIAALNGVTLGGGAEIALACDMRVMGERGRIGFPEVNLGVFPGSGGVFRLPRLIGPSRASWLLFSGEIIDASTAVDLGLVDRVVPQDRVLEEAMSMARSLASRPALALSLIKAGVRDSASQNVEEATERTLADSHRVFVGPDIEEGITAFFAKRSPRFTASRDGGHPTNGDAS